METEPRPVAFAGNDYLGLSREPRLAEAMARAARDYGVGATSGRFFLGWTEVHQGLERELAAFFGTEEACLLSSTYLGGLTFFTALADQYRTVFCDAYSHANLVLGMRAAGCDIRTFRHLDAADLREQLLRYDGPPPIVATDTVFGISGECAPLRAIAEAARAVSALLLLDDAHGAFTLGQNGRGACEVAEMDARGCVVLGSMSKALGCHGGFFAGPSDLMRKLQRGTAGASPAAVPVVAACREALRIVQEEPQRRARLQENTRRLAGILRAAGVPVVSDATPILAMLLRDEFEAQVVATHLEARGLIVRYAKYPSEPRHNLLRSAARAVHTAADFDRFAAALKEWRAA